MLFRRYQDPAAALNMMTLRQAGFFIIEIYHQELEEKNEDILFETWLHRGFDTSYAEFKQNVLKQKQNERVNNKVVANKMTNERAEQAIKKANSILNFKPDE